MRSMDRNTVHVQILDIMKRVQYIEYNEVFILLWLWLKVPVGEWLVSMQYVCVHVHGKITVSLSLRNMNMVKYVACVL